jgi:hypothetical protein
MGDGKWEIENREPENGIQKAVISPWIPYVYYTCEPLGDYHNVNQRIISTTPAHSKVGVC